MKQAHRALVLLLLCLVLACGISILSCGGSSGSSTSSTSNTPTSTTTSFAGTQPPGDYWSWSFDSSAGTFTGTNNTKSVNYSGTSTALSGNSSGISKLTLTSTTDTSIGTLPQTAYAVQVPNTALLVATPSFVTFNGSRDSIQPPVFAAAQGSCPTTGATLNWVMMPPNTWCPTATAYSPLASGSGCSSSNVGLAYGTAVMSVSGGSYGITVTPYHLDGTADSAFSFSNCSCGSGVVQCIDPSTSKPNRIAFTPSGVFFIDTPNSAVAGVVQPDANIDMSDFLKSGRQFKGLWYTALDSIGYNSSATCTANGGRWFSAVSQCGLHTTQPIKATTDGTQLIGNPFVDIDAGTLSTQGGNINFANSTQPAPGLIKAKFTANGCSQTSDIVMAVRQINGKYVGLILTHTPTPCTTFDVGFNVFTIEQ